MRFVGGLTPALGVQESLRTGLYITNGISTPNDLTFNNSLVPSQCPDLLVLGTNVLSPEEWKQIKPVPQANPDQASLYLAGTLVGAAGFTFTTLSLLQLVIEQCTTPMQPPIQGHLQCLKYAVSALFADMGTGILCVGFAKGDLSINDIAHNATRWVQGVYHDQKRMP